MGVAQEDMEVQEEATIPQTPSNHLKVLYIIFILI